MKSTFRFLVIASVLVAFGKVPVKAQPLAHFVSPANNSTGVSVGATITITTKWKIDSSSLNYVLHIDDIVPLDTLRGILVLPKYAVDSVEDSAWYALSQAMHCTIVNDTTLSVTTGFLQNASDYVAIIKNLRVVDTFGDTLSVPDSIRISFKTANGVYEILGSTVLDSSGRMRCSDTMKIHFNQPLDSANTPSGPLFTISALNRTDSFPSSPSDTTPHSLYRDSLVSSSSWVDPSDSNTVDVTSSSLVPGRNYLFREWPSRLTGDTAQNRYYTLNIKGSYNVQLSTSGITGDSTYVNRSLFSRTYNVLPGDTDKWIAPAIADSFKFVNWICPADPSINGSLNDTLTLTADCASMQDLNITANFAPLPIDTIEIDSIHSMDSVSIFSSEDLLLATYSGTISGSSTHSFPVRRNTKLILIAKAGTGFLFDHWNSNNSFLNGLKSPKVLIQPVTGGFWATPVYAFPLGSGCSLQGIVESSDNTNLPVTGGVAEITSPPWGIQTISTFDPCPPTTPSAPVTLKIDDYQDVGLWQTTIITPSGTSTTPTNPTDVQDLSSTLGVTSSPSETYSDLPTTVVYDVRSFTVNLQVEIAMSDGSEPPTSLGLYFGAPTSPAGDVTVFDNSDQYNGFQQDVTPWTITNGEFKENIYYKAGVHVTLTAATSAEYQFVGWSTDAGYTFPSPATNENWGTTQIHGDGTLIKVKAVFQKLFKLLTISVAEDPDFIGSPGPDKTLGAEDVTTNEIAFDRAWSTDEREIWLNGPLFPSGWGNPSLEITFHFNDIIDASTLYTNILCAEEQARITGTWAALTYLLYNGASNYTITALSDGTSELKWDVSYPGGIMTTIPNAGSCGWCDARSFTPVKLQKYSIQLTSGLKSIHGVPLSNPTSDLGYIGETVNPDVTWTVTNTVLEDIDDGPFDYTNETYLVTSSSYGGLAEASGPASTAGQAHISGEHDQEDGDAYGFNTPVVSITRAREVSVLAGTVTTMDQDDGDIFNQLTSDITPIQTQAQNAATSFLSNLITHGVSYADTAGSGLLGGILGTIETAYKSGWGANTDDEVGQNAWKGNRENWWGGASSFVRTQSNGSDNGTATTTITVTLQ